MAAAKTPDPLDRVKELLGELSDAVDALSGEEAGEGEAETEASPSAPPPNVAVSLPWRKGAKAKAAKK
jgi:hypothetical protein